MHPRSLPLKVPLRLAVNLLRKSQLVPSTRVVSPEKRQCVPSKSPLAHVESALRTKKGDAQRTCCALPVWSWTWTTSWRTSTTIRGRSAATRPLQRLGWAGIDVPKGLVQSFQVGTLSGRERSPCCKAGMKAAEQGVDRVLQGSVLVGVIHRCAQLHQPRRIPSNDGTRRPNGIQVSAA